MNSPIYLDYNATTPIDPDVLEVMLPYLKERFGNPSSVHSEGNIAHQALHLARNQTAQLLGCEPSEIIFTSGGSESNNLALKGIAQAGKFFRDHILVSAIEHPSVLEVAAYLSGVGYRVDKIPVSAQGRVDPDAVKHLISEKTLLVSVMHANNEVGTIQPVREIAQIAHEYGALMHSDAAQTAGKIAVNVQDLNVDLLTLAGHKMYSPKGVGALFVKAGINIFPQMHGANQENGKRAGTENVASIAAFGKACELIHQNLDVYASTMCAARDILLDEFQRHSRRNLTILGNIEQGLPNTLSLCFEGVGSTDMMAGVRDIAMSPGAACHARDQAVSHVLTAMRHGFVIAHGAMRLSTGRYSTPEDMHTAAELILEYVNRGR